MSLPAFMVDVPEPMSTPNRGLGEILIAGGAITSADLKWARDVQRVRGGRVGSILVDLKLCTEDDIRAALCRKFDVTVVNLRELKIPESVLGLLSLEFIRKYEVIPLTREGSHVRVAMMDPHNLSAMDDIRFATGCSKITIATCAESDFNDFLEERLSTQSTLHEIMQGGEFYDQVISSLDEEMQEKVAEEEDGDESIHELKLAVEQPPIITLCNYLLAQAIDRRASDIHLEPYETYFRVRLRVDGRLQTLVTPPRRMQVPVVSRYKVMASMDITKRRSPQDGRISMMSGSGTVNFRVSTLPTIHGEKCVIRLLARGKEFATLDSIGMQEREVQTVRKAFRTSQGLVLITGPTGSGKTTTVHTGLIEINEPDINIVTLEDPVETAIPGINHVQIDETANVGFSAGLRSILRQDPDVIFIGEMRDPEVARIAIKASLTGHLVVSTLHTNGAVESLVRLDDLGIPRYLTANAVLLIVAQRLLRRVCTSCEQPYQPTEDEAEGMQLSGVTPLPTNYASATFKRGKGCDRCMHTGYYGRLPVYEILRIDNKLQTLIRGGAPVEKVVELAQEQGMVTLLEAGLAAAFRGETTMEEVARVLFR